MDIVKSSRFKGAPWFPVERTECIIGGAGGIGSWLTLLLTRAGFQCATFDFDVVDELNMGGQWYNKESIGRAKVFALQDLISSFTGDYILPFNEAYTKDTPSGAFVFAAFDSIQARRDMFESWQRFIADGNYEYTPIFIDGRLLMEQLQILCVTPDKIAEYEKYLFEPGDAIAPACTLKQTSHSAAMIAAHMVGFFTNHYTNCLAKDNVRAVPFYWEYFIPFNYIKEL